ncbi:uncharacterized protein UTRI_06552_B [Ustilago trichophora]|uniref:Uncharacterized protein n=1 Tax=Ustilago trichophora TaxID=86804 RepID=A0A5C3EQL3_9BASI|nr:uncharacterized protein UTRI_06552_B [Ustilago trichophora]
MNCDASYSYNSGSLSGAPLCAPFWGLGHMTNCSILASTCYTGGYIVGPTFNNETLYVGTIRSGENPVTLEFEECAQRVVGQGGKFERGYVVNEGCGLSLDSKVQNSTRGFTNSGAKSRKKDGRGWMVGVTYLVVIFTLLGMVGGVGAMPNESWNHHHHLIKRQEDYFLGCRSLDLNTSIQTQILSPTIRLSSTIDCRTSSQPCLFSSSPAYSVTFKSSIIDLTTSNSTADTTVDITRYTSPLHVLSLSASLGRQQLSVRPGQTGYLAAYAPMTRFRANLTLCEGGGERLVQIDALKNDRVRFIVINTN